MNLRALYHCIWPGRFQPLVSEPMLCGAIAAGAGIFLARELDLDAWWPVWVMGAVVLLGLAIWRWRQRNLRVVMVLASLMLGFGGWEAVPLHSGSSLNVLWTNRSAGESLSAVARGSVVETRESNRGGRTMHVIQLQSVSVDQATVQTRERILAWVPESQLRPGDVIEARGLLHPFRPPRNPGQVAPALRAMRQTGAIAELEVATRHRVTVTGVHWRYRPWAWAAAAREHLGRAITHGIEPGSESAAILQAMFLGAREEASPETEKAFQLSGTLHIFAVSGLNVAIFGSVIWFVLQWTGISRRPAIGIIIVCILLYAFVTGLPASAVRAALMMTVLLAAFWFRRQPRLLNSLGAAALIIFLFAPGQIYDIGFQLSFGVMVAIGIFGEPVRRWYQSWVCTDPFIPPTMVSRRQRFWIGAGRKVADVVAVSVVAWLGSLPFVWWYFGLITPSAIVANVFVVPLAIGITWLATFGMVLFGIHPVLALGVNRFNGVLVNWMRWLAVLFANMPGGHFQVQPLADKIMTPDQVAPLIVFDTGRSCGPVAFRSPEGKTWLIDSGSAETGNAVLRPWLRRSQVRQLEGLVLTHGDASHTGAARQFVEDYGPGVLVGSHLPGRSRAYRSLEDFAMPGNRLRISKAGDRFEVGDGATLEVLFPPADYPDQGRADDECLVTRLNWKGWRILFLSDSGFQTEKWLLENSPDLTADVLVKSQHGSDFSGLSEFIRAARPRAVVATNAPFPEMEHITEAFRQDLAKQDIALFDQSETGAVLMDIEDGNLTLRAFVTGERVALPPHP